MEWIEFQHTKRTYVGVDEVGRGAWAGPMVACACALTPEILKKIQSSLVCDLIRDSKKMTKKNRKAVFEQLRNFSESFHIREIPAKDIDKNGIQYANTNAFHELITVHEHLDAEIVCDHVGGFNMAEYGNRVKMRKHAESHSFAVALASVYAKEFRDGIMRNLSEEYSAYGWESNVGYGTRKHAEGIRKNGITKYHRKSFLSSFGYTV